MSLPGSATTSSGSHDGPAHANGAVWASDDPNEIVSVFAPDLVKDPLLQFFERTYSLWLMGFAGLLFAIGGWSLLLWAFACRSCWATTRRG